MPLSDVKLGTFQDCFVLYIIESIANRSFASLWYKMSLFLSKHEAHKITAKPRASLGFQTTIQTFQMR